MILKDLLLLCGCCAAITLAAPISLRAENKIPDDCKTGGFFIGCQAYTFNHFSVFEAIDKTVEAGGKVIEFYPGQTLSKDEPNVKWDHNASAETIQKVKDKLTACKVTAVNYGVVDIPKDEAEARKIFEFATIRAATVRERVRLADAEPLQSFFYPQPRLRIGRFLRQRSLASAMIDLSDGLSLDLARLCKESGAGARVFEAQIPRTPQTPLRDALHGGEDLELLFTVPPGKSHTVPRSIGGVKLTRIGQIISGKKLRLVRGGKEHPLPVLGFQHF